MRYFIKQAAVAGLFLLSMSSVFGQTFGFKGGLNLSNMVYKPDDGGSSHNYKVHSGFHLGIITNIPFSKKVSLETDMILSTKGIHVEREKYNGFSPDEGTIHLLYLDIPLAVKIFLSKGANKPYVLAGPYAGFGISGKATINDQSQSIHFGSAYDEDFKDLDFGFTVGGGLEVKGFLFGLNYDIGLINIYSHDDIYGKVYNRNIRISIGYVFPNRYQNINGNKQKKTEKTEQWWK